MKNLAKKVSVIFEVLLFSIFGVVLGVALGTCLYFGFKISSAYMRAEANSTMVR